MTELRLETLTDGKVRNLSGHERGLKARDFYNLNEMDETEEVVRIIFPDDLDAIATSFFQGMFSESIKRFNSKEDFLSHYSFVARPEVIEQVFRGIDRVMMKRGTAFAH